MNNVYINLKDFYGYTIKEIFRNQDLVTIKELVDKLEEYSDVIEEQAEETSRKFLERDEGKGASFLSINKVIQG